MATKLPKPAQISVPKIPPIENFQLTSDYLGYVTKPDATNIAPGYLVTGSQNMVTNNGDQAQTRKGYTLLGAAATNSYPIISSYEWITNRGTEHALRRWNDTLEVLYNSAWYVLKTGLAITGVNLVNSNFAELWNNTTKFDNLIFTDGTAYLFMWTGSLAIVSSNTVNTITLTGSLTWAALGFPATGSVVVNGVTYSYTGGTSTTTLTGLAALPTFTVGIPVFDVVVASAVSGFTGTNNVGYYTTFTPDLIAVYQNQVYIASLTARVVLLSKAYSYTDYSLSNPRIPTEGGFWALDACPVGFAVNDTSMSVTAGRDFWYTLNMKTSADNASEILTAIRLKTQPQKAALSQGAVCNVINDIYFISQEPTFDSLGRVEQINNSPQTSPLSDLIKPDFDAANFTNCHSKYWKNNIYLAVPGSGLFFIRNVAKGYWETPQTAFIRRWAVIAGQLIGHSSLSNESYTMFNAYSDNGNTIKAVAALAYNAIAAEGYIPNREKSFTEHYTEGYISPGTDVTLTINYDYMGYGGITQVVISGDEADIIFANTDDDSLGTHSLGEESLGGGGGTTDPLTTPNKFRVINTYSSNDYFEYQPIYSSDGINQVWAILRFGPGATISTAAPVIIKK